VLPHRSGPGGAQHHPLVTRRTVGRRHESRGDPRTGPGRWRGWVTSSRSGTPPCQRSRSRPPGRAREGGDRLAEFYAGVNASRAVDPDPTALGHSYGSVTTGYALQHPGTGVDRAVFVGSPGLGTSDVTDLEIPDGAGWDADAEDDPVANLGRFGRDPSTFDRLHQLETGPATTADGQRLAGVRGHSEYLQARSTSQYTIATIITGHPDDVIRARRDNTPGILDPSAWWSERHGR
jgi:pimeloyl-ACP methyl ester carboxylesterase